MKVRVQADTSQADAKIDKLKKDVANKNVEIPVSIDMSAITKALHSIQGMVGKMSDAFDKDVKFSGIQKGLDDIYNKIQTIIKTDSKGNSFLNVNTLGLEEIGKNISLMTKNIEALNESKINIDSFEKLASVLENVETLVNSIVKGMNFDAIRPSSQVQQDIEDTTLKLEKLAKTEKKISKLESYLNKTGIQKGQQIIEWGDSEDVSALDNFIRKIKEYIALGGDLSKIKFKAFNVETETRELYSLLDVVKILQSEHKFDTVDEGAISNDVASIQMLRNSLSDLNEELVKAQNRENRDLNVSFDTASIEKFSSAVSEAMASISGLKFEIPEDFSFDGLSTESLDKIIGKLDEIVTTIANIGNMLSTGIDASKLDIQAVDVNVTPKVDVAEFIKKIEEQLESYGKKVNVGVSILGKNGDNLALIDNEAITGLKPAFKEIASDFGFNLQTEVSGIKNNLNEVLGKVNYEKLFSSLRNTLLDIVVQFQNSLDNVSFSKEQTNEIYKLLHKWQEASNILSRTGKDSERAALLNQSTGSVSNSYLYDKETGFSGQILVELNRLSAGVSGEIRELYDTWLHSHPFREELKGLKTIGSDIGFTPEDFEVYRNRYLKQGVANMMVANNGKYTNINWDGISEEIMNKVIKNFKASDIWDNGAFIGKIAQENGIYNFDKQSSQINNAIVKAMQSAGISDAEQRVKVGNIEDLKVDMSALHQEEQKASEEAQELIEVFRQLGTVLDSFSGESFKFGISEESLDGIINKLNEIVEAINKVADANKLPEVKPDTTAQEQYEREVKAIEEVIEAEQKLDNEQKDHVDNSQEVTSMQNLADRVDTVITAVDLKTRAFQEEEQIVVGTVQRELSSLELLDAQLYEIVNTLDKIKIASSGLDFNSLTNVSADNGLSKLLTDLSEQLKGLDIESLSKLTDTLNGLNTTGATADNLTTVANALIEFKNNLSGINIKEDGFLSSINSILSKKDELQNLCKILESSAKKIKEVQNATNNDSGKGSGIEQNIQEDAEKASQSVKELKGDIESLYSSLRKSIKGRDAFGTEHFIDDLMEVSKKYKSIQELRTSNPSLISVQEKSSIEEYFAKFKMSADDFVNNIDQMNKTPGFIKQLKQAQSQLESVKVILDKVKAGEAFTDEDIAQVKEFISQIRNLNAIQRNKSTNFADMTKVDKLLGNVADDLRKHTIMTKELRMEYEALQNEIKSYGDKVPIDKLKEFESTHANLNRRMKEGQTGLSFFDGIAKKARTMSQNFIAMYFSLYDIIRYILTGITYIRELDTAFTEMRKVSDESTRSLKNFQKESFNIANAVGTTAVQIQNSTADWLRLGESFEEAKKSAEVSNILKNVSEFESIDDATESLVAMSAAYDELDKIEIVDKLNNIGNNYAIATDGLATALQASASALRTAGNDIDESIALVTAGNQVVQDPDKVGAGIRTIALRITGTEAAKAELEEMGEDVEDFVIQTSAKSQQTIKDFTRVASNNFKGFDILDDNGNFKSTFEILLGISKIYAEIVETDKKYGSNMANGLLEALAGKNRSNIAASILQNPEILESVYKSSQSSDGSAQQELEKYLDSIDGKIQQFTNEVQEFWYNLIDSEVIKGIIDIGTTALDIINKVIDGLGEIGILITVVSGGIGIKNLFNVSKGKDPISLFGGGRDKELSLCK